MQLSDNSETATYIVDLSGGFSFFSGLAFANLTTRLAKHTPCMHVAWALRVCALVPFIKIGWLLCTGT